MAPEPRLPFPYDRLASQPPDPLGARGAAVSRRPASAALIRAVNDRLALDLLVANGPLSRSEMAQLTGLSKPTVAELLDRLLEAGLIEDLGESDNGRPGPNARRYGIPGALAYVAGAQVRGDSVLAAIADITGRQVGEAVVWADPDTQPVHLVHRAITDALADSGADPALLHGAVVGTPGFIDPRSGEVAIDWDLPVRHRGVPEKLRADLGRPAVFENDTNLAAVAEYRLGAAQDTDMFALLDLGQGVGLAVVIGGGLHRGANGGAGEIGYMPVPGAGFGPIGSPGTPYDGGLQAYVGAEAIIRIAREHGIETVAGVGVNAARAGAVSAVEAARTAEGGSGFLDALAYRIAVGAASVCTVLDPGFIVLTGAVARAGGEPLAARVERELAEVSPLRTRVVLSALPRGAALRGAILVALDAAHDALFGSTAQPLHV